MHLSLLDGGQDEEGVEVLADDGGGAMGQYRHYAEDQAEAVEERYGKADALARGKALALADVEAVVDDVVVA